MLAERQFLFVIGSPRSGTTWLQIMVGAHPRVVTTVELCLFEHYTSPWINSWNKALARLAQTGLHQGLPCIWTEDEFYGFLRTFLSKVYGHVLNGKPEASHILDKSCAYSFHVEEILRLLPNARFIHMIRDGRDVAVSMMAAQKTIGAWGGTVKKAAGLWKEHVTAALKTEHYDGQYLKVRYEDLLLEGPQRLKECLSSLIWRRVTRR